MSLAISGLRVSHVVGAPLGVGFTEPVAMAIHHVIAEALVQKTSTHTLVYTCVHASVKATDIPIVTLFVMLAVVAGLHNTETPHSGGETEATMAANTMRENRGSQGKRRRRRCERVN